LKTLEVIGFYNEFKDGVLGLITQKKIKGEIKNKYI
jgi:hypothetical protein